MQGKLQGKWREMVSELEGNVGKQREMQVNARKWNGNGGKWYGNGRKTDGNAREMKWKYCDSLPQNHTNVDGREIEGK